MATAIGVRSDIMLLPILRERHIWGQRFEDSLQVRKATGNALTAICYQLGFYVEGEVNLPPAGPN